MIPYIIESGNAVVDHFAGWDFVVYAASEQGARDTFKAWYPQATIYDVSIHQYHLYSLNGRYSRYFKS